MINNSLDVLYLMIAFFVFSLTICLVWGAVYIIKSLREFHFVLSRVRKILELVENIANFLNEEMAKISEFVDFVENKVGFWVKTANWFGSLGNKNKKNIKKKQKTKIALDDNKDYHDDNFDDYSEDI